MGLEYATKGTMTVDGRKIVLITKDDQTKPDVAKTALAEAYEDDKVDIAIGTTSSAAALAMLPVAEERKKILIVEPAVADQITGEKWNRYIFRTGAQLLAGRDLERGRDRQAGRDGRDAGAGLRLRPRRRRGVQGGAAKTGATLAAEEYAPMNTTDFTAPAQRLFDALKDKPGRKIIWVIWAGASPMTKLQDMNPGRYGIELVDRRQHPAGDGRLQDAARHGRRDLLLLRHPEEPGERLARGRAPEALQRAAGLLHGGRLRRRDGGGDGGQEGEVAPTPRS